MSLKTQQKNGNRYMAFKMDINKSVYISLTTIPFQPITGSTWISLFCHGEHLLCICMQHFILVMCRISVKSVAYRHKAAFLCESTASRWLHKELEYVKRHSVTTPEDFWVLWVLSYCCLGRVWIPYWKWPLKLPFLGFYLRSKLSRSHVATQVSTISFGLYMQTAHPLNLY